MVNKIIIDEQEYDINNLSDQGKTAVHSINFISERLKEMNGTLVIFKRAHNSYLKGIREEIIADKAGLLLNE